MSRKVGMPKDKYRCHWFFLELPLYVSRNYITSYNYLYHDYMLFRRTDFLSLKRFRFADLYTVVKTSKKCIRVTAHNNENGRSEYRSFKTWKSAAEYIESKAREWNDNRDWEEDTEYINEKYPLLN